MQGQHNTDAHDFTGTMEEWERRVFMSSDHFSIVRPSTNEKTTCKTFTEAWRLAVPDDRALIYVVAGNGRFVCCDRKDWTKHLQMWAERLLEVGRGNVERHLGDVCETPDQIYDEVYTLAVDGLIDFGCHELEAQAVAQQIAQLYAQP